MLISNPRLLRRLRSNRRVILIVVLFLLTADALIQLSSRPPARPTTREKHDANAHLSRPVRPNTTVFVASVHRNTEPIIRTAWANAVIDLAKHLGPQNVFFSAVESGSQDDTKGALTELQHRLDQSGVDNRVKLGLDVWEQLREIETRPTSHEAGWVWNKADRVYDLRRIPYLAKVRNDALEPLRELAMSGRRFSKVLWLNDVVFDTEDVLTLLDTRDGHYAAACSMDFKVYPCYYDTFALRDDFGQKTASLFWPWFMSPSARASVQRGEPTRVFSCWNGIVVFDSAPYYSEPPLRFRGIDDSLADFHLEGSECCLVHADNPLSSGSEGGVWLNPNVRVGYDMTAYQQVKGGRFPGPLATVLGIWANRLQRIKLNVQFVSEGWLIRARIAKWKAAAPTGTPPRSEPGEPCLVNEMQIMWQNGWKHL